jgi:hypothetical protein
MMIVEPLFKPVGDDVRRLKSLLENATPEKK